MHDGFKRGFCAVAGFLLFFREFVHCLGFYIRPHGFISNFASVQINICVSVIQILYISIIVIISTTLIKVFSVYYTHNNSQHSFILGVEKKKTKKLLI